MFHLREEFFHLSADAARAGLGQENVDERELSRREARLDAKRVRVLFPGSHVTLLTCVERAEEEVGKRVGLARRHQLLELRLGLGGLAQGLIEAAGQNVEAWIIRRGLERLAQHLLGGDTVPVGQVRRDEFQQ